MALTRKMLKAMDLSEETIETIIEAHADTVTALTNERDTYKEKADTLAEVTRERDTYKAQAEQADGGYKEKYEAEKQAHEQYKAGVAKAELNGKRRDALLSVIKDGGVTREEFQQTLLNVWDLETVELDESGAAKDPDAIKAAIAKDYPGFVAVPGTSPVPPVAPPSGGGPVDLGKMDMADYIAARKKK